jgi:hypothetical protein
MRPSRDKELMNGFATEEIVLGEMLDSTDYYCNPELLNQKSVWHACS